MRLALTMLLVTIAYLISKLVGAHHIGIYYGVAMLCLTALNLANEWRYAHS
jgi:hypothetical protein